MTDSPIGLIGVGLLGTALAQRMHQAGFLVSGYDQDWKNHDRIVQSKPQAATPLVKMAAATQLASQHETIVLCLPDSNVVQSVLAQIDENLRPGMLLIDATTGDPDAAVALAARLAQRRVAYIDATIAGSSEQALRGEAVLIVGGASEHVQRAQPILESWSSRRIHAGAAGSGQRMKLIVNLVLGLNRAVLAEGLSLARACGIDLSVALEVLKATPAYSKVMDTKGPKMIAHDYAPQARLAQHLKDVRLIRDLGRKYSAITPLSDVHETLLQQAVELGYADADNSAVIESWKTINRRQQR